MSAPQLQKSQQWHFFIPKLYTVFREGYGIGDLRHDAIAGLTVAIVALPLAMALAVASGTTPERGIYTAIVAGFLISLFGGSRFQIGGPTGAFVVVVFNVITTFGYDGLVQATLMAGVILIFFGLARFGDYIKYIPYPVVTGFTSGIALIIFSSQIKELLGLEIDQVPGDFIDKWALYAENLHTIHTPTVVVAGLSLVLIAALRHATPKLPAYLFAIIVGSAATWALGLDVDTIGTRFGGIPHALPMPSWPTLSLDRTTQLLPSAFTIAFLAGVESLLSAVVADGMTGRRHRSNCELVAQGFGNIASVLFGGIPATGAIARTATNIRSGGRSPISGMLHAVFLMLFMLFLAPLASYVPLASLGAVLVIVAWNMSEISHFRNLLAIPAGDRLVLLLTFALTVLVDLTVAIEVGVVLAAILFMHRMSDAVEIQTNTRLSTEDIDDLVVPLPAPYAGQDDLPDSVEVYQINGPFFFGAAARLGEILGQMRAPPEVFILRMRHVPLIDATGASALFGFIQNSADQGTTVILSNVQPQPRQVIERMCKARSGCAVEFSANFTAARKRALSIISSDDNFVIPNPS